MPLQAQLQDLLLPYAPQFLLLQQDRTTIHKVQPKLQVGFEILPTELLPSSLPSSSTCFFSKHWFFLWLPVTLEWNSWVELCWWQIISICAYFVSNIWNFGTSQSILQGQSCFPETQRCWAFHSTSSCVLQLHCEQVCSVFNSHL